MISSEISTKKEGMTMVQNDEFLPKVEKPAPIHEDVQGKYDAMLRHHFLYGSKISEDSPKGLFPVLSSYQIGNPVESDYPIIYDAEAPNLQSFNSVIQKKIVDIFDEDEKEILIQALPSLLEIFHERLLGQNMIHGCEFQLNELVSGLRDQVNLIRDKEGFHKHCDKLKLQLSNYTKDIIGFSGHTVFQLVNLKLIKRRERNIKFLEILNKDISGLQEVLRLYEKETDVKDSQMDFASNLISFDQVNEIVIPEVSSGLPESRLNRLKNCLEILLEAKESYSKNATTIFVSEVANRQYSIEGIFSNAQVEVVSKEVCAKARQVYKSAISQFVNTVKALRIAGLEINQQYDDNYHNTYFDNFEISYLNDEDNQYFRTIIIIDKSQNLVNNPTDLLALLSENALIKVLTINNVKEISGFANNQQSEAFQRLVSMAIFNRDTNIYQGGAEDAQWLNEVFKKGLEVSDPVLWNIILSDPESNAINKDIATIKMGIDSRFFPRFNYQVIDNQSFGERIDLKYNLQPEASLPSFQRDIKSLTGKTSKEYKLSMADFMAMNEENLPMLEILPPGYDNEALLVLDEYLLPENEDISKKVPFIWLIDEKNTLKRAAVPMSWISRCRSSLDFWHFLLELSGRSRKNLTLEIEKVRSEWEAQKKVDMEALNQELKSNYETTRKDDLEKGIKRILNAFIDGKHEIPNETNQIPSIPEKRVEQIKPPEQGNAEMESNEMEAEPAKASIQSEAWVESEECTSCNDCTNALPTVFKYNSDKQAFVHNPKGGPYSKIVAAAEKCPAACIHPGLPHDSKEKGLEKLIKRAEKFN